MAAADQVQSVKNAVLHEEAMRIQAGRLMLVYEQHEFTLPILTTDASLNTAVNHSTSCTCARSTGGFDLLPRAQRVVVRNVGIQGMSLRLNAATNDLITIDPGEYMDWNFVQVSNLYLTNSGASGVAIRIALS